MPKKRFSAEQIVTVLRQIEVGMAQEDGAGCVPGSWDIATKLLPLAQGVRRA